MRDLLKASLCLITLLGLATLFVNCSSSNDSSAPSTPDSSQKLDPCPSAGDLVLQSGVYIFGNCVISGSIKLNGTASITVAKGDFTIQGDLEVNDNASFAVENSQLIFPQTDYSQYEIKLNDSANLSFDKAVLSTNGTTENNFSMTLVAKDSAKVQVTDSSLETLRSWLLGNFFDNSQLIADGSTNIPTEIYPEASSSTELVDSIAATVWFRFEPATAASINLPSKDAEGFFDFGTSDFTSTNLAYNIDMNNSRAVLGFSSLPNSDVTIQGNSNEPDVVIGYYIIGNTSPVTLDGLVVGNVIEKSFSDSGRNLTLKDLNLGMFAWQVYGMNNSAPVTIQNSVINELGAFPNSDIILKNSVMQLAVLAAPSNTSHILVQNSDIWVQAIQASNGGEIIIEDSNIHGNFFSSSGCTNNDCSLIDLRQNVVEMKNGTVDTCPLNQIFQADGTPNCNPLNPLKGRSSFNTADGGQILR